MRTLIPTFMLTVTLAGVALSANAAQTSNRQPRDKAAIQADRDRLKADRAQLRTDKQAGNDAAVQADKAKVKADKAQLRADGGRQKRRHRKR
ncbi:MAG: hypothetical protein U0163_00460 [Gemmatimonadaceae bacterium]